MVKKPKCLLPRQKLEEVNLRRELAKALETPVKFVYDNNMIEEITSSKQDYPWITNMKRAVLNMIQINWQKRNQLSNEDNVAVENQNKKDQFKIHFPTTENDPESDFYRVMEKTLEGTCEVAYSVSQIPSTPMEKSTIVEKAFRIRKSINFENCQKRPEIRYNYRFDDKCSSGGKRFRIDENILKSSTIVRMDVLKNGDNIVVQNSMLESQYAFMPMMEEQNMVVAYVKLPHA
uniref:Vitellogenin domain-containing protein n=1 Tax=Romanomermis culicivorax TaxID=13658 RepID=A0A915HKA9_ROMCU